MEKRQLTTEQKLILLKKLHAHSDPNAIRQLVEWEDRIMRLEIDKKWMAHTRTKELRDLVIERVNSITSVLANKEDLGEIERRSFFAEKKSMLIILTVLTDDPMAELENIKSAVDYEAENL